VTAEHLLEHWRRREHMFHGAAINQGSEAILAVDDGYASVRLTLTPQMHHAGGAAHGAVIFKLLDDAAYFAAASQIREVFLVTVSFTTTFLRPASEGVVIATGRVLHRSRNLCVAESSVHDPRGRLVATGSGTFQRSSTALNERVGYR
jgi:uncharacterized protein (TIGR00369 family)